MRLAVYTGASVALATGVILSALHQRTNFYSACVYLAQSNACLMILTNVAMLGISVAMLGLQKLLYGPLRPIEVEQLYEKAWFAITETCLAMTTFREEVGGWFLVMFVSLLVGKVWGWIGEGRVEVLEQQPPANPRTFHARLSLSLAISTLFDAFMLSYTVQTVLQHARPNMMVMFAFEFAVLCVTSISTTGRYCISLREASIISAQINMRRAQLRRDRARHRAATGSEDTSSSTEASLTNPPGFATDEAIDAMELDVPGWEDKGRWIFYLDLATDFLKLTLYLTFFCVLCMFYGMPIHIIRDVAITIRSFHKRIADFIRYRHATRNMNARYPDATSEEVEREDCCIICREDMRAWPQQSSPSVQQDGSNQDNTREHLPDERLRPKKLPCGHVLHFACLKSWLERQQNCPTCRAPVLVSHSASQPQALPPPDPRAHVHRNAPVRPLLHGPEAGHARLPAQNVFHIGPLRVAFGARNIPNGPGPAEHGPQDGNSGANDASRMHPTLGHQRAGDQAQSSTLASLSPLTPSIQIQNVEQQLVREINNLRLQADQLFIVRALHSELNRLRAVQAQATGTVPPPRLVHPSRTLAAPPWPQALASEPAFTSSPTVPAQGSGHEHLPNGMSLPEGWTVLPMQRVTSSPNAGPPNALSSSQGSQRHSNATSSGPQGPAASTSRDSDVTTAATGSVEVSPPSNADYSLPAEESVIPGIPQWGSGSSNADADVLMRNSQDSQKEVVDGTVDQRSTLSKEASQKGHQINGNGRPPTVEDSPEDAE